jgi:uncharacterized protein
MTLGFIFGIDLWYYAFIAPGVILALWASWQVKATFKKYGEVMSRRGLTGAEAAAEMLRRAGVSGVTIEPTHGFLSDHYDPSSRTLRLSEPVYGSTSLSAIGVACHEAGHALQHAHGYSMLALRSFMVPATQLCSTLYIWVIIIGSFLHNPAMILAGVALFSVAVVFAIVTLPVEWDASARAKVAMNSNGLLSQEETVQAGRVLNAAFLTYVASAVTAILTLLYYLWRLGLIGGGRRD